MSGAPTSPADRPRRAKDLFSDAVYALVALAGVAELALLLWFVVT